MNKDNVGSFIIKEMLAQQHQNICVKNREAIFSDSKAKKSQGREKIFGNYPVETEISNVKLMQRMKFIQNAVKPL